MNILSRIFGSTLGKKYLMAISGAVLVLFVIGHMLGNLQVFGPPHMINEYAELLRFSPELLWAVRIFLLLMVVIHVRTAIQLVAKNRAARPVPYLNEPTHGSTGASRVMIVSGLILLAFIIFHLAHFTFQVVDPSYRDMQDADGRHDVHAMVIQGFSNPLISLFYIGSMALLFHHLSHGIAAMFQSFGLRNQAWQDKIQRLSAVLSWGLFAGFSIVPLAILFGFGR